MFGEEWIKYVNSPWTCLAFIVLLLLLAEFWGDVVSSIISALRGPRQIISSNICPKCQKTKTVTIDPEN